MSTISHPPTMATEQAGWTSLLHVTEIWASLAIAVMWIAVSVSAVWGPDLVSYSSDNEQHDDSVRDCHRDLRDHRHVGDRQVWIRPSQDRRDGRVAPEIERGRPCDGAPSR